MDHQPDMSDSTGIEGKAAPAWDHPREDPPALSFVLWPNRSLSQDEFRTILWLTATAMCFPLLPLLGTKVGAFLIPFLAGALLMLYLALKRSYYDGRLTEEVNVWPDLITVTRRDPFGRVKTWDANPFWVRLQLYKNARIENYLTLDGNGREIELGAFLSPEERVSLYHEIHDAFCRVKAGTLQPAT